MDRHDAGIDALLFRAFEGRDRSAHAPAFLAEGRDGRVRCGRGERQRMVRRDRQERGAVERVRSGREDFEFRRIFRRGRSVQRPPHHQPFRAADPVRLHEADFFRPFVERVECFEQIVGEGGDFERPLHPLALFDQRARSPAAAIDDLFVGQHGVVDGIPVDLARPAVREVLRVHIQEQPLLMTVVARIAGRELAAPIDGEPHRLELVLHRVDVGVGPGRGMRLALHRGVLGRHPEGVPAHRMEHVEAARALVAGQHITHGIVAHVTHMDAPRRIREHLEHVALRLAPDRSW